MLALPCPLRPQQSTDDWSKDVDKACTNSRYGLRLAASKKVGEAGDDAVPAVRQWQQQHGKDRLPVALVEAIADRGGDGPQVVQLLREWATDREFFWRAQALKGLAHRASAPAEAAPFRPFADDPAWLMRTFARYGLVRCGADLRAFAVESDPRADTRLATLLLGEGHAEYAPRLVPALADERTCLGIPWGKRRCLEAFTALVQWLGQDAGFKPDADYAQNCTALERLAALVTGKCGTAVPVPPLLADPEPIAGGVEVLSCRNGDLFVRWTAAGELHFGLDLGKALRPEAATWQQLSATRAALRLEPQIGVVICDKLMLRWSPPEVYADIAPAALPADAGAWLEQLAAAIEQAGDQDHAAALRDRLQQFNGR